MKLTFLGADREVTGSCTQVEAAGHRFLVDCGMEQGRDVYENADLPCAPGTYEALLLTHAHIDHSGRIPYLYKNGYRGPVYTTEATRDLCAIMLEDSAHIQEQEAEWKNRKAMRSGAEMIEPDYTVEDAQNVMKQFVPCPYEAWQTLFDGPQGRIEMRFTDVGHLLGSASISLRIAEPGRTPEVIVFSGDIGNRHQPLLKDPANPGHADYLVMESTYGDRSHGPKPDYLGELSAVLQSTFDKGGNVVIPSFAVGRTQELLYFLRQIKAEGRIKNHADFPVFVDSPLASKSTTIFKKNFAECYDEEALALVQSGRNPLQFPGLHVSETKEESMAINGDPTPKVIISAAGMCDAGRIRHHLKYNLCGGRSAPCCSWATRAPARWAMRWSTAHRRSSSLVSRCRSRPASPSWAGFRATPTRTAWPIGCTPLTKSRNLSLSTTARMPWPSTGPSACAPRAMRPTRRTTARSGLPPRAAWPVPRWATPAGLSAPRAPRRCAAAPPMTALSIWASA